ncbi:surfeit locus protein 6 homolog [Archocentrus centrarchus]|uniref:surfeit locus protein 6 homolog n=1 Tax=Archocentrus centrarchus TaxID=63155 RepID=UPI0011E9FCF2|nr:surfeit locus protein 6 homolog [Archocentrus centrarchus]XP_030598791.1 surfeit locus protein 6 [Archocentrus centrarchus]
MDLVSKDSYIQKLASKVFSQRAQEPKKRPFVHFKGKSDTGPPKKKKKCKKKHFKDEAADGKSPKTQQKPSASPTAQKSKATPKPNRPNTEATNGATPQKPQGGSEGSSFSTVDVLRKRLHEKIEESRGQGAPKDTLSEAVQAKRAKRKLERERKKKKRKEFLMKKLAEQSGKEQQPEIKQEEQQVPASSKRNETAIIFNKVETVEEGYIDKKLRKKKKKEGIKGQVTPLTGKNYKQLLSRVEARKAKLEQLREKDEEKAREMEKKIMWTNMLYKAEGIKIKDNEEMLRESLKKKEKRRTQRKKKWNQRSEHVLEKMQQRQDKRRKNLTKRKQVRAEKKKERARKKGRVLPEDLKKATV